MQVPILMQVWTATQPGGPGTPLVWTSSLLATDRYAITLAGGPAAQVMYQPHP